MRPVFFNLAVKNCTAKTNEFSVPDTCLGGNDFLRNKKSWSNDRGDGGMEAISRKTFN